MMEIVITYGKGKGLTELAAFDSALWNAGIGNYNLLTLSSIVPPNSKIEVRKIDQNMDNIGDRLYVVIAKCIETDKGKFAYAGLGWITNQEGSGIFLEERCDDETELKEKLKLGMESVIRYRNGIFCNSEIITSSIECMDMPVCAIVAAVYYRERW